MALRESMKSAKRKLDNKAHHAFIHQHHYTIMWLTFRTNAMPLALCSFVCEGFQTCPCMEFLLLYIHDIIAVRLLLLLLVICQCIDPPPLPPFPSVTKQNQKNQNKKTDQQSLELHKWCVFRIYRWGETIAKWCLPRAAISHIRAHEHQTNKAKSSLLHSPAKVAKSSGTMNEKNKQKKDSCKTSVTLREPVKVEGLHAKEHKFKFSCSTFCCCCS